MKIEDIIEDLNRYLYDTRNELNIDIKGHFVLHKQIIPNEKIKAYKEINYNLWYIDNKYKFNTINFKESHRIIQGDNRVIEGIDNKFIQRIFIFIRSKIFDKLLKGEYNAV